MRIVRLQSDQAHAPENPEYFSGTVRQQRLNPTKEPGGIDLVAVFFEPGARTRPHIHATDQALHVVEGEGVVATEQERRLIRTGDIVIIRAGQWHWHGATPTSAMFPRRTSRLAVSLGPGGRMADLTAHDAHEFITTLDEVDLSRFRVVGTYARYDEAVRNALQDARQKILAGFEPPSRKRENHLIWAALGTGKKWAISRGSCRTCANCDRGHSPPPYQSDERFHSDA